MADKIYLNDSAVIESDLTDSETGEPVVVASVKYQFNDPNGIPLFVTTLPSTPFVGQMVAFTQDASPWLNNDIVQWDGTQWNLVATVSAPIIDENNTAIFVFPSIMTNDPGLYKGRAQFVTDDGLTKSSKLSFEVIDPMETLSPTIPGQIIDHAWLKLEDLFDSELGGPWLRDKTVQSFNKDKMAALLMDALYVINNEYQPVTDFTQDDWPAGDIPLAAQALLIESIYHLIRSYVEQPTPQGSEMSWFDRRDYFTRWQSVLTVEEAKFFRLLDIFKLQFTGFGSTSMLIGGHSSPITRLSKMWRTRYPRWIGPWGI